MGFDMIEFERLADCKGSNKFGCCVSCGAHDRNTVSRIRFMDDLNQGTSVCLCDRCIDELVKTLMVDKIKYEISDIIDSFAIIENQNREDR